MVKAVDRSDAAFGPGLAAAARLAAVGIETGAPLPTADGRLFAEVREHHVAVLRYVDGDPLTSAPEHHPAIGTTLGRVHRMLPATPGDPVGWFDLVGQFEAYLGLEPWVRPAVEHAQLGLVTLAAEQELSWATLHGDPAPEAFRAQPAGGVGLIDWGSAMTGPVLYDVASAAMYVGGESPALTAAYLAERPGSAVEVRVGLPVFLRFRWAVQAAYFAWRCSTDVRTGLTGAEGNVKGLNDARRFLGG